MPTNNTSTRPGEATGLVIHPCHQALASTLAVGQSVGTIPIADVLALLDDLDRSNTERSEGISVGSVTDVVDALHGRHSRRTLQRVVQILHTAGILHRTWPADTPQPRYELQAGELRQRLGEASTALN